MSISNGVKPLFISSVNDAAGKNMLLVGLAARMQQDKYGVGFFKPIGNKPFKHGGKHISDEDVVFFQQALNIDSAGAGGVGIVLNDELMDQIIAGKKELDITREINSALAKVSGSLDVLLIKGMGRFYRGSMLNLSENAMIKDFNWQTILIDEYVSNRISFPMDTIDGFIAAKKVLGNLLVGVVFNAVPESKMDYLNKKIVPFLEKKHKIDVLGVIPHSGAMGRVSIKELKTMLPGELLSGRDKDAETIENFCVSPIGGGIENDIRYFNQNKCKAVVTSGDRTDIQLAALDADAQCLILTGHLYPSDIVLAKAEEKSVPVMVARDDTLKAMDKIRRLQEHFGIYAPSKVKEAIRIVQKNVNFKAVYKKIGLSY